MTGSISATVRHHSNESVGPVDVIVIGSGAAGLSAALAAAVNGASVVILEKSELIGGTSAMSGAGTWIPNNHHAREAGVADSAEAALIYLCATAPDGWIEKERPLWESFVHHAPDMLRFLEQNSQLRFELVHEPDPICEAPGGKPFGRMLSPAILSRRIVRPYARQIRRSTLPHRFTYNEVKSYQPYRRPIGTALRFWPTWLQRVLTDRVGCGSALIAGLLEACLRRGCRIFTDARVHRLIQNQETGRIEGVEYTARAKPVVLLARQGVVLASGGFEWDPERLERHFPGPVDRLASPRTNTGDGQRMAESVGALMERMDQANIYPTVPTIYQGRRHGMPIILQASPHCLIVNRHGRRFVSEYDYNIGEALDRRDPATGLPLHLPAWIIGDRRFLHHTVLFPWLARLESGFLRRARSLPALAQAIGVPSQALLDTVARFNGFATAGKDDDFHRGESAWERYVAGKASPALSPIEKSPFVAVPFNRSILGTKGGARTNARGQVLRPDNSIIGGLYCAGNAMANPIGTRAVGAGTTIGPCLTWGYICGLNIVRENT